MAVVALVLALLVANVVLTRPAFDRELEGAPLDGLTVLPLDKGLTLARLTAGGAAKLVIVHGVSPEGLQVVDVGAALARPLDDPLAALATVGLEQLEQIARTGAQTLAAYHDLGVPLNTGAAHIAAGTNYAAHARETGIEDGVFLFPKLSAPTAWNAGVSRRGRFDYEAELCAVPLTAILPDRPSAFGYVLCNDFTDRWPLVRDIDFDRPMGTTGFPEGKGGPGMMPLGPFFVVPRDDAAFRASVTLELFVNGRLRQRSSAGLMIWSPEQIAAQALKTCKQDYHTGEEILRLADCAGIPAGTVLLTGTPEGVLFHPATIWNPLAYLRAGDEVLVRADGLGVLHNRVE
jgi:2-keto-4-pentenoate hydratase/2-oxohepta-3-ene-1,7-dioic acid hydratase in catechol pathway